MEALPPRVVIIGWERDPSVDQPSDVGESHLRGRLLKIKCK